MSKTPQQYVNEVLGKRFDEDGVYGCQCVDAFKHFCRTQLGYNISHTTICDPTGYAYSIWDNYKTLGFDKYFDKVRGDSMVDGDWAIWEFDSVSCPKSHIAMFRRDNNNNICIFLGQNQLGHPEFTQVGINYNYLRGAFRPKIYHEKPQPTPKPSENPIYETLGEMYVRWGAGINYPKKLVRDLTADGKKNATSIDPNAYAVYRKGTRFTVYEFKDNNGGIWGRSPSGWICIKGSSGTVYCKVSEK